MDPQELEMMIYVIEFILPATFQLKAPAAQQASTGKQCRGQNSKPKLGHGLLPAAMDDRILKLGHECMSGTTTILSSDDLLVIEDPNSKNDRLDHPDFDKHLLSVEELSMVQYASDIDPGVGRCVSMESGRPVNAYGYLTPSTSPSPDVYLPRRDFGWLYGSDNSGQEEAGPDHRNNKNEGLHCGDDEEPEHLLNVLEIEDSVGPRNSFAVEISSSPVTTTRDSFMAITQSKHGSSPLDEADGASERGGGRGQQLMAKLSMRQDPAFQPSLEARHSPLLAIDLPYYESRLAVRACVRGQYSEPFHSAKDLAASQAGIPSTDHLVEMIDFEPVTCHDAQIRLLDLAPEVLLKTLSCLGLRDIMRARIFSSYFKQTIDNESNFPLLVSKARFKSMKKLDKLTSTDDDNVQNFDYLQILAEMVARRGLWTTKDPYILTIHIMMDLFMRHEVGKGVARAVTWDAFWRLGYNIWQVHIQRHLTHHGLRCINWVPCVDVFDFVRRVRSPVLERFGITEERMALWYILLIETPGGYLQGLPGPRLAGGAARMGSPVIPKFCLTGLYAFDSEISTRPLCPELKNHYRAPVVPDASKRLAAMLEIPELPTQFEAYGRMYEKGYAFAWCVHSESVFKKVQDALTRVDGKELKSLEKAIIVENLFLF
ncbi:hypothetical protein DOTSEDRAFT_27911 [Dothistroma septosporum NZE10]|uniref:F-box domain-containing protein n=1 Tax=Dothistroma septosporum (strain NZE10 / CBS 128990) TaxID=675120 RepID=N1PC37_DOTSN|nr:hypothetical protein DOTSEDRAFT_27911 [Dothistroma septosporum NZE10]